MNQGYNVPAYHGTFQDFEEFKEHDIGFHFSKAREIAQNRIDDRFDYFDITQQHKILEVVLSIHNPIVVHGILIDLPLCCICSTTFWDSIINFRFPSSERISSSCYCWLRYGRTVWKL